MWTEPNATERCVAQTIINSVEKHVLGKCDHHACEYFNFCTDGICGKDCIWWRQLKTLYGVK